MPLESPQLDDHLFDDLVAEAKLRLQRYCPEWTDFNDSDPGMALVQLFAWLTELMIYRINQVPERSYIEFLRTLNLERRSARPATTRVVFTPSISGGDPEVKSLRARAQFFVPAETGDTLTFESLEAIDVIPYPLDKVQVFDGLKYDDYSELNATSKQSFRPLSWIPQIDNALYLGFQPPQEPLPECEFPDRIVLHFFAPMNSQTPAQIERPHASGQQLPQLVWEYASRFDLDDTADQQRPFQADRWRPLSLLDDQTQALTQDGRVVLRGPGADCVATKSPKETDELQRYWIRCRLVGGKYPQELIPEIAFVRSNVVEIENRATYVNEVVAIGDGTTVEFQLQHAPVDEKSLELELVDESNSAMPEPCTLKTDFLHSTANDLHVVLNANSGVIRFGNGKQGRIPGVGQRIVAKSYRAGGGTSGNVAADTVKDPPLGITGVEVTNPRPATGGSDEESLQALLERAPRVLRGDARAVTKDDYRRVAEDISGVGRAVVIPNYLQQFPELKVPGTVTVVVIPATPQPVLDGDSSPPRFQPSVELLRSVAYRLDEVRPAGAELAVAAPRLHRLDLDVTVSKMATVSEHRAREQIKKVLENYFRPVEPRMKLTTSDALMMRRKVGNKARWELGSPVYASRLFEVLLNARDEDDDMLLVQDVADLKLLNEGKEVELGKSLPLGQDELPLVYVDVKIAPPHRRRDA